jgi:hypothetical protein
MRMLDGRPRTLAATIAATLLLFAIAASSAAAAARPTVAPVGLAEGLVAGQKMPYLEAGGLAELSIGYAGKLPGGAKLELLQKLPDRGYKASKVKIHLVGGRAKVKVTYGGIGGPVSYKVVVVSGSRQLAVSHPLTVYYTQLPGGVFAEMQGAYASYTSRTNASETCANPAPQKTLCDASASGGETDTVAGFSGTYPVPPGWSLTLTFNGEQECTSDEIDPHCEVQVTFPEVSAETLVDITATLTSPRGERIVATRVITVYPG